MTPKQEQVLWNAFIGHLKANVRSYLMAFN